MRVGVVAGTACELRVFRAPRSMRTGKSAFPAVSSVLPGLALGFYSVESSYKHAGTRNRKFLR